MKPLVCQANMEYMSNNRQSSLGHQFLPLEEGTLLLKLGGSTEGLLSGWGQRVAGRAEAARHPYHQNQPIPRNSWRIILRPVTSRL
jgi:hypothetical protein